MVDNDQLAPDTAEIRALAVSSDYDLIPAAEAHLKLSDSARSHHTPLLQVIRAQKYAPHLFSSRRRDSNELIGLAKITATD